MTCPCQHHLLAPDAVPKAAGRLLIDHAALRRELGDDTGIREFMTPKASGRPTANVAVLWDYFTKAVYKSGDLPWLAARECLQNALDACRAAVKARQIGPTEGRFDITWDPEARSLTFDDNGIGMDERTILDRFLSIGESGKRDAADSSAAAGGFGVAKAVILGCSRSFRWNLHTRDNLAVGNGAGAEVEVFDAPMRQGASLVVHDVDPSFVRYWDRARNTHVAIDDRLRELLAANDLPGFTLSFNGVEVKPMFSRRGGSRVDIEGSWGDGTTAAIKAYRRPAGDRGGAWYLRLGGLFQVKVPAQRGAMKADVVVDLTASVRPGARGYPFNAARDALQDQAYWTFADLVDEVERENESVGRSEDDVFIDPDDDSDGAADLAGQLADALGDAAVRKAIADAAGGIRDFYGEQVKHTAVSEPASSVAPRGTRASGDAPERTWVLPAGVAVAASTQGTEGDAHAPSAVQAVSTLRAVLGEQKDDDAVDLALRAATGGRALDAGEVQDLERAVDRAAEAALAPGGGGLMHAVSVAQAHDAVAALSGDAATRPRANRNPFGAFAGMRIARKTYDSQRAARFRKGFQRWVPYLLAWDATLRLVAGEARIRRTFRPGFVLDDDVVGEAVERHGGRRFAFIHPDRFAGVVRAHRERPLAIAGFLHGVAVHELTHIDGRMGDGHDESFVAAREDLGAATVHLLPAIAVLVTRLLGLPERPSDETKKLARVEHRLEVARAQARTAKAQAAKGERHREDATQALDFERELVSKAFLRKAAEGLLRPEAHFLDEVVSRMMRTLPPGTAVARLNAFVTRHRAGLLGVIRAAAAKRASMATTEGEA